MTPTPARLSARELQERLASGERLQLVDVREDQELEMARLNHPVLHLPLSRSQDWLPALPDSLDPTTPVVVLCHAGMRSWQFGCWLLEQQAHSEVWNLEGGIDAWSVDVDPSVPRY
ncbi:sulfurtransferase [Synechococcus sp. RSCCF101]|uniref:rhodanese-like domain-containing protein n=1 Tax=Synechococcus sp. RSCCF101 TaxID=2511069 RepID=UPI001248E1BF|nr:rhodanese-like domain-containing protein [Synechococcus sp. RSCCF101]QEY32865.1 sulfurtransferase [Synechococcus sp. RSCCF101]